MQCCQVNRNSSSWFESPVSTTRTGLVRLFIFQTIQRFIFCFINNNRENNGEESFMIIHYSLSIQEFSRLFEGNNFQPLIGYELQYFEEIFRTAAMSMIGVTEAVKANHD